MRYATSFMALLGSARGMHSDPKQLRGYICKQHAHQPCTLCPEGYFCSTKDSMQPCGDSNFYCPLGSFQPIIVSEGYYSLSKRHAEKQCPEGFFCVGGEKKICPEGFRCPTPGLSSPLQCGDSTVFCEEGSIEPTQVRKGYYSVGGTNTTRTRQKIAPRGYYASAGIVKACPAGHFGSSEGLSQDDCSGICLGGWFCPSASVSARQIACGAENRFCPPGSEKPQQVRLGYYTSTEEEPCRPGTYREPTAYENVGVSPVATSRKKGKCVLCRDGYKHRSGDDLALCLDCGSTAKTTQQRITCECYQSATEKTLFQLKFDPVESKCFNSSDGQLPPDDFHLPETQFTKTEELPCGEGHYCHDGTRYRCPSGRYGNTSLQVNKLCDGACAKGHWCSEASKSPTQHKCGAPNLYCPIESSIPIYVSVGYYTDEDEPDDARSSQQICPKGYWCEDGVRHPCDAGRFGETLGLSHMACSGRCLAGYFCLAASTSRHQYPCGNSTVYCPEGSKSPLLVRVGYYSTSESDAVVPDYFYAGPNSTSTMQLICEIGYYCEFGMKFSCPAGTYGVKTGASDASECQPCSAGMYCPSHPGPPSTEDTQLPCGKVDVYCPRGSPEPLRVDLGHYSINESAAVKEGMDTVHTRTAQVECESGYYCQHGIRYPCRAGTYGETPGLVGEDCSGLCPRSHFCPENSVKPLPCSPAAYATGGAKECTSCDIPPTVPTEIVLSMCRDDRSCCLDVFDYVA